MLLFTDATLNQRASLGRVKRCVPGRVVARARTDYTGPTASSAVATLTAPSTATTYSIGVSVSDLTGNLVGYKALSHTTSGTDQDDLGEALLGQIEASPDIMGFLSSAEYDDSADTVTLTGKLGFNVSMVELADPTADIAIVNTAQTARTQYLYGRAVELRSAPSGAPLQLDAGALRVPQVVAGATVLLDITHAATSTYQAVITLDGDSRTVAWASGANAGATATNAKAAFDVAFADKLDRVSAAVSSNDVLITAAAGLTLYGSGETAAGSGAALALVVTAGGAVPSYGIVLDDRETPSYDGQYGGSAVTGPLPGSPVLVGEESGGTTYVAVDAPGASLSSTEVWVSTTAGATLGRCYDAPASGRVLWRNAKWDEIDPVNPNIAYIKL